MNIEQKVLQCEQRLRAMQRLSRVSNRTSLGVFSFLSGIVSVISLGLIPSILHRFPSIQEKEAGIVKGAVMRGSIAHDFCNVAIDLASGIRKTMNKG